MKTFKEIVLDIEEFVNNHNQLHSFGFGKLTVPVVKDLVYPYLHIQPTQSVVKNGSIEYTFNMIIVDVTKHDDSNTLDVVTNTMLIGRDFISAFFEDNNNVDFELNNDYIQANYKYNTFDDNTTGWSFNITLQTKIDLRPCITPKII